MVTKPWSSTVPFVIDALVGIVTAKLAVLAPTVLVKDGPWISQESIDDVISIGWSGFEPGYQYPSRSMSEQLAGADISAEGIAEGLSPAIRERFTIACASMSRRGSDDVPTARRAAFANVALVGGAIAPPNHTLNGTVLQSTMATTLVSHQVRDRRGALVIVTFSIEAQAFAQQ